MTIRAWRLVLRSVNTLTKMRRNFGRRQGAMTSSGGYHARKSNAADGKKDKQIRQRIAERNTILMLATGSGQD